MLQNKRNLRLLEQVADLSSKRWENHRKIYRRLAMTQAELEQSIAQHDREIAEIRRILAQMSQENQIGFASIRATLNANTEQIAANAEQIAANSEQIAANAERSAANAEQIAANAEQIAANAEQIAANAEQIAANTAGLVELRSILADYLRGRSNL
jgi:methyl-accepting chemotaxis protein